MYYRFIVIFLFTTIYAQAQSLDQAKILYSEGEYAKAKPVFEKLVEQSPNNSSYNQWYGVCCYETGDVENAEKYLLIANSRKVMESYRYLAMLYTQTYRFDEAIAMWEGFIEMQRKKKDDASESEAKLEQARNLLRMQEKTEDVRIIDSVVVDKNAFLTAYSLSNESGVIMPYGQFFQNATGNKSIVYMNQKGDRIYYARPSSDNAYTLYTQSKLLDAWGDEKTILPDNATADNNYPFVLSDGTTLYFASKGNGSIGGYDIFVTRYNTNTNAYLSPEQLGMPFNSPANDYMMVVDEAKGLGWFVTDRNQPDGKACVYLFIPDPSRKRISSETDPDMLRARSALTAINLTWEEGVDYGDLVRLAHTDMTKKEVKKERQFEFIVNDKTVYYTLAEIKSHEARDLYADVLKLNKQAAELHKKLNEAREQYAKGNEQARKQLRASILQTEEQLHDLTEKAVQQEKKARNAENRQLGTKL